MTMLIPFRPDGRTPFQFTVSVGGTTLFATALWNLYANRYYLKLTDNSGDTVVFCPMVASPDDYDINLALAYAPGKLIYRESSNQFEAS
ncbi:hypothetical protein [Escherichia coli]|uniref:hypothetical protein n=1 Tax=Escherichia coli TaxID=562 RepID=UPI001917BA19|nr:hypothetical protein [Escherichia coli]CAD6037281.1 Uncharacterised protein [Escherichia coli]CAD6099415.1 Uncharacterised protein [Escherichia coli]CAD6176093.1 Uncharacterised protein [Escherichia coli]